MAGFVCLMPAALIVGIALGSLGAWPGYRHSLRAWLFLLGSLIGVLGQIAGVAALVLLMGGKAESAGIAMVGLVALVLGFFGSFVSSLVVTWPLSRLLGRRDDEDIHQDYQPDEVPPSHDK